MVESENENVETTKKDLNNNEVNKEEVKFKAIWHVARFMTIYIGSLILPVSLFMLYILLIFLPFVLETTVFIELFTNLNALLSILLFPLVFLGCYTLHLFLVAVITRFYWQIWEKKSPSRDGNIPRNIPSKALKAYHKRSFIIKYPKYLFTKGIFPWLANWMYNFVGSNKIGKGTTIEEQICADKYIQIGENCYIGVGSVLTSHLVEGIFGRVTYFKLLIGDNVTLACGNNFASGCKLFDDAYLLPWATGGKHYTIKGQSYYYGGPLRKIRPKKLSEYLNLTPEQVKKNEEIMKSHKKPKSDLKEENITEEIKTD